MYICKGRHTKMYFFSGRTTKMGGGVKLPEPLKYKQFISSKGNKD